MSFSAKIKASVSWQLARHEVGAPRLAVEQIDRLATDPYVGSVLKGELEGLRRVRVGAYRIVIEVRDRGLIVLVVRVGHLGNVYRRRWRRSPLRPSRPLTEPLHELRRLRAEAFRHAPQADGLAHAARHQVGVVGCDRARQAQLLLVRHVGPGAPVA